MSALADHHDRDARMDLFAIHAPAEIPPWFAHGDDLPPLPAVLSGREALDGQPGFVDLPEEDKEHLRQWILDGTWDLASHLDEIGQAANRAIAQSHADRHNANQLRQAQHYFAWRWHYASAMLAAAPTQQQAEPPTFAELRKRFCAQVARCDAAIERAESTEQQAKPAADERAAFEAWAIEQDLNITPGYPRGAQRDYAYMEASYAWRVWQGISKWRATQSDRQVTAPEGYALVPAVPTHNMLYALLNESEAAVMRDKGTSDDTSLIVLRLTGVHQRYAAMLAAAGKGGAQ